MKHIRWVFEFQNFKILPIGSLKFADKVVVQHKDKDSSNAEDSKENRQDIRFVVRKLLDAEGC